MRCKYISESTVNLFKNLMIFQPSFWATCTDNCSSLTINAIWYPSLQTVSKMYNPLPFSRREHMWIPKLWLEKMYNISQPSYLANCSSFNFLWVSKKKKFTRYLRPLKQSVFNTYCGFHGQIVVALQCCVFIWVIALVVLVVPFVASVGCRVSGRTDPREQDREVDQAVEQTKDHHQEKDLPRQGEITSLRKINAKKGEISMQKKFLSVRKKNSYQKCQKNGYLYC